MLSENILEKEIEELFTKKLLCDLYSHNRNTISKILLNVSPDGSCGRWAIDVQRDS
jgi:hypothetical protein